MTTIVRTSHVPKKNGRKKEREKKTHGDRRKEKALKTGPKTAGTWEGWPKFAQKNEQGSSIREGEKKGIQARGKTKRSEKWVRE